MLSAPENRTGRRELRPIKRRDDMSDNANPVRSTSLQGGFLATWLGAGEARPFGTVVL
jgi:hypothetical protein